MNESYNFDSTRQVTERMILPGGTVEETSILLGLNQSLWLGLSNEGIIEHHNPDQKAICNCLKVTSMAFRFTAKTIRVKCLNKLCNTGTATPA